MTKGTTNNPLGRPKGVPNKITAQMRDTMREVVSGNASKVQGLFDRIADEDPARAVELWIRMASFVIPKPSPIEAIETEEPITGIEVKIINSREELEELNREKK